MDEIKVMIHNCRPGGLFPSCRLRGSRGWTVYLRSEEKTGVDRLSRRGHRPLPHKPRRLPRHPGPTQVTRERGRGQGGGPGRAKDNRWQKRKSGALLAGSSSPLSPPSELAPSHCRGSPKQEPRLLLLRPPRGQQGGEEGHCYPSSD